MGDAAILLTCSACRRDMPPEKFSFDRTKPHRAGRSYRCRSCDATRRRRLRVERGLVVGKASRKVRPGYYECSDCRRVFPRSGFGTITSTTRKPQRRHLCHDCYRAYNREAKRLQRLTRDGLAQHRAVWKRQAAKRKSVRREEAIRRRTRVADLLADLLAAGWSRGAIARESGVARSNINLLLRKSVFPKLDTERKVVATHRRLLAAEGLAA